ncbi:MAG TPA: S41 family peptidase [Vicinamibacterales bacterium]|nr:S41 family peptidase [Vicinamibacterales bacterium]
MRTKGIPAAAGVVVLSTLAGGLVGATSHAATDRIDDRLRMYTSALSAIEREYVEPVESSRLVYGSIDGMLRTLDPHSSFLEPKQYERQREQMSGRYPGIGISILSLDGQITVTKLFEGSPAYRAGIRRNDVIARVGQPVPGKTPRTIAWEDTKGWGTEEVVKRVRGPKGTTVEISIRRPGVDTLIDLTVERDQINMSTVTTAFMIAPGTGYARLQDFSETTDEELGEALKKLKVAGMQRLMLDLRDNPGGPLDQAIAVSSRFLKRGQMVVQTKGRIPNSDHEYRTEVEGGFTDVPMIVMTNRNSASAAEIVSGAMQDHDRALLVGETTFGKALVQGVYTISSNAGLALTTGRYYTPSQRMIQRPWDGSFDEYLTYSYRDQTPSREHAAVDLKYTDAGRKVYSGGGIEPDHFVPGPVEGFNPSRFSRMLRDRGAFISFAERFTKEGDKRPAAKSAAAHKVAPGWQVTDAIVDEFKQFVASERVRIDEAAFKNDVAFIKAMIRFEVDADLFGIEEARRNLSSIDPQVQTALGYFEGAKQLLAMKRTDR